MICFIVSFTGCGDYGERIDRKIVSHYTYDCKSRGFKNIEIIYIFGKPSTYYECF